MLAAPCAFAAIVAITKKSKCMSGRVQALSPRVNHASTAAVIGPKSSAHSDVRGGLRVVAGEPGTGAASATGSFDRAKQANQTRPLHRKRSRFRDCGKPGPRGARSRPRGAGRLEWGLGGQRCRSHAEPDLYPSEGIGVSLARKLSNRGHGREPLPSYAT